MSVRMLLLSFSLFTLASVSFASEETYKAPSLKLSTKTAVVPVKAQSENWDSSYKVDATPTKTRGVASEPNGDENQVEAMPIREPSSVKEKKQSDEGDLKLNPIFWKYQPGF